MIGRRLYKTKLCMLFQRGRCSRQNCNFAHGEAELRRFAGSFDGRRDHRNGDLRDKLDRRHSPHQRYSSARDGRGHRSFHNQKPVSYERGSSLSRSPIRRSERRYRKKQQVGGESDASEGFRVSDDPDDRKKEEKASPSDEKHGLEEQLKQIQLDNEILEDHMSQLETFLEEKVNEADKLSNRIEDVEAQLKKDQDDCKRMNSKIEKFIKLHAKRIKLQEELKRVEARLRRETEQVYSDLLKCSANGEDSSENVLDDAEHNVDNQPNRRNHELLNGVSSTKKRQLGQTSVGEEAKKGDSRKRQRYSEVMFKLEKLIGCEGPAQHSETFGKCVEVMRAIPARSKLIPDDHRQKHARSVSRNGHSFDKGKGSEVRRSLPSTAMAAHAADEIGEATGTDERLEAVEAALSFDKGDADYGAKSSYIPLPPPLLSTKDAYKQYEGDDEEVDVEKVDDMLDIDLNSEVEIEQV